MKIYGKSIIRGEEEQGQMSIRRYSTGGQLISMFVERIFQRCIVITRLDDA